jgi:Rrf2 family transcriptional regulator, cysteine metabolism repressor
LPEIPRVSIWENNRNEGYLRNRMKLITKDTDYAIAALCALAKGRDEMTSAVQLARELRISHPFLRKILRRLAGKVIVRSRNGLGGGFMLAKKSRDLSVREIVEIFQGPIRLNECVVRRVLCERADRCVLRRKLKALESRLVSDLMRITIASLVAEQTALVRTGERKHG